MHTQHPISLAPSNCTFLSTRPYSPASCAFWHVLPTSASFGELVPVEIAMPSVLHAIGATKEDIDNAMDKAKKLQAEKEECERCEQKYAADDHAMNLEERKIGLKKTEAEAKKIEHDAHAPFSSGSSGPSGSSGSSSR